jgi:thiazole/oxazole-forming peptide maturase SagD family component
VATATRTSRPIFYPYGAHLLEDVLKPICSEHGGILQSLLVSPIRYSDRLDIKSVTAQMPSYHKILLSPHLDLQYHLSGYGTFYEEALIRLVGEAIERYSLLVAAQTMAERIEYASYDEISSRGRVVPIEYMRPFSDADYENLNRGQWKGYRRLEPTDIVGWIKCPSLFDPENEIWIPAQMLFVGYKADRSRGEVSFFPGFSTGTASHMSLEKALQSAILEFIEIDALMLQWYTDLKAPAVTVDDGTVSALAPRLFGSDSEYDVLALDLRVLKNVDAHVFASILINRDNQRPFIVLGAQGQLDPIRAFYRSLMEAVAGSFLGIYGPLFLPKQYLSSSKEPDFTDLDRNVSFFASAEDADRKRQLIQNLIGGRIVLSGMKNYDTGDTRADTIRLIRQLSSVSEYAVFLDITPPETRDRGWKVARVFFPELLTMCVPGVPYSQHPRIKAYGGITNQYPHPLP